MLYCATILICLVVGTIFRDTRIVGFLGMGVLAYLSGAANPLTTLDYPVYLQHYQLLGWETSPFERGYTWMSKLFFDMGFNYAEFRLISMIITFLVLFVGVCIFTKKVALFTGLYGVTVFFNDATQVRNLMMIALVILGAGLMSKKNKFLRIVAMGIVLLSTQFHALGFVFLIFLIPLSFIGMDRLVRYFKPFYVTSFVIGFIFAVLNTSSVLQLLAGLLEKFSSRQDSATNLLTRYGRGNSFSTIALTWLSVILLIVTMRILMRNARQLGIYESEQFKLVFIGSCVAIVSVFLIILAPDYSRISRNAFLFLLIMLCMVLERKRIIISNRNLVKILTILSLLIVTTYANTRVWGSTYYDSIPYLAKIK